MTNFSFPFGGTIHSTFRPAPAISAHCSTSSVMSHVCAINKQNNYNITYHRTSLANERKCEQIIKFGSLSVVARYYETTVCRARL